MKMTKNMKAGIAPSECSFSHRVAATSEDFVEDDGSVYTEENDIRQNICPGGLVRACGTMERSAFNGHKYKLDNTVMPVWLESKKKLVTKDVLEALWIVSRQVPHLQFCHSKRRGKIWFKRIKKLEIDFEITSKNELEVCHDMLDTDFDVWNGPLWKVKLIECKDKEKDDRFCTILIFTILHSLNDGVTNIKIVKDFVLALNNLLIGQTVAPVFSPVIIPIDKMLKEEATFKFLVKKLVSRSFLTLTTNLKNYLYFSKVLPLPKTKVAKTQILIDHFTENETQKMLKMCKDQKITLNTFICTIANFALLNVAQARSTVPIGRKKIRMAHSINLRRHFEPSYRDAPGYHASVMEEVTKISLQNAEDFWKTAQKNHSKFLKRLNEKKEHLKTLSLIPLISGVRPVNRFLASKGYEGKTTLHYISSNMGDVDKMLPETKMEDNVCVTYLIRTNSSQFNGSLFALSYQTLRRKLILSMDYYTNTLTEGDARELFDCLYTFGRNVINYNRLVINNTEIK